MSLVHAANYYPPPPIGEQAPVRVEIHFNPDDVDRSGPIPQWTYRIEVTLSNFRGIAMAAGGTVEAITEDDAQLRVYSSAINLLGEMLAAEVVKNIRGTK